MSFVNNPTYLLAPNWTFRPGGPITLGSIVGDPFRPHRWLSKPGADTPTPETVTTPELNWRTETDKVRSANVSLWTKIFDFASFDVGAHRSKSTSVSFEMSQLDTVYFAEEPSVEEITTRARDPRVRAVLKTDSRFRRGTVYMVTGLKIARGFKLTQTASANTGANIGAEATVNPDFSAGGSLELNEETRRVAAFEAANDIIFAYQLLRITPKGRGEKLTFEMDEFQDGAFLNDDGEEDEDGPVNLETDVASLADLAETQKGLTVNPDSDQYAWLFPSE
ncbi:hypothetical protein CEP52_006826 [Fusarium oligoseptatum]|uniref:Uncharacterized protein n=1 Tax=Fusarium oligoseptatum TaxID=2604345 RepID=A0A428TQZ2_9HYPO|nr:hypothetical protein CEP52_006826 [Fusarium oligoseptatum]